jgi:hypothetical protein
MQPGMACAASAGPDMRNICAIKRQIAISATLHIVFILWPSFNISKPVYNIRYLLLCIMNFLLWIAFLNGLKNAELGPLTPPR